MQIEDIEARFQILTDCLGILWILKLIIWTCEPSTLSGLLVLAVEVDAYSYSAYSNLQATMGSFVVKFVILDIPKSGNCSRFYRLSGKILVIDFR